MEYVPQSAPVRRNKAKLDSRANAPRWHAFRDAPRHKYAPRRTFKCWTQSVQKCIPTR
ncbi:DUF1534 domain-containing protein, partial [Pseudomonas syringae pv. actinidiae]|nr:DUF1534 domain-containing protein [Pseudomonas syringae pv. actinidiae]